MARSLSAPAYEPQITVNYNAAGSGAGITAFTQEIVNFGETDAPMTTTQYAALPAGTAALTIPISASAVVPAYNLKLVNGSVCQNGLNFTGTVLSKHFLRNHNYMERPGYPSSSKPKHSSSIAQHTYNHSSPI